MEVPSDTISKVCAASLRAVNLADSLIRAGDGEIFVAGGIENMSSAPYLLEKARSGYRRHLKRELASLPAIRRQFLMAPLRWC